MIWWLVLQQQLVELLQTLPGFAGVVVVYDGPPLSDLDAQAYVTVGWSDSGGTGTFQQVPDSIDGMWGEAGHVVCEFVVTGGDEVLPLYRAEAFDLVVALDTARRTDQTFGVLPAASTSVLSCEIGSAQDSSGATQRLIVAVNYTVRR